MDDLRWWKITINWRDYRAIRRKSKEWALNLLAQHESMPKEDWPSIVYDEKQNMYIFYMMVEDLYKFTP